MRFFNRLISVVFCGGILLLGGAIRSNAKEEGGQITRVLLTEDWRFRQIGTKRWYAATVPGCVHTDLLSSGVIADPFYRDNEKKLQWIGKTDWEYICEFTLRPEILEQSNIEVVFEGLDTYAEVYLNGTSFLTADNMFREWRVPCKELLRNGKNTLRVRFDSPINKILPVMEKTPYQLPAGNDQGEKTSPYTRKAPYHYGWDWGPRFVTSGIWRPVYIEAWGRIRINHVYFRQESVTCDEATLEAVVELTSSYSATAQIAIGEGGESFPAVVREIGLKEGENVVTVPLKITRPKLWWPNGYGDQHLYRMTTEVRLGGEAADRVETSVGLRSLELRRRADQWGKSFEFVINGIPVFAKGGNWIPADSFPNRVSKDRYRFLLQSCADANMNMMRVWGGGIYEAEFFYQLCDELGIMVWQDFMFACSMYPGDPDFLESVRQEAAEQIKRLRNHPSIVLWCGNNEVETAWFNWGWKESFPGKVWQDYEAVFHNILPQVCASLDPSRPYWPSSPSSDGEDAPNSERTGDNHFWDVWHGTQPFEAYEKHFPRFSSEYGFQSFPLMATVNSFALPEDQDIDSPVMLAHQKHPRGNQLIREYMLRDYREPKDFASFLYVSQLLQAEGIKIGAEHLRRIKHRCMGSLYWQINDCWPVASWSGIDYFGRWKALHYYARRFYNDILISPNEEGGKVNIYVVSDRTAPVKTELTAILMDFSGKALEEFRSDLQIKALSSEVVMSLDKAELSAQRDTKDMFLYCTLLVGGEAVSSNEYFFHPLKELNLLEPGIELSIEKVEAGWAINVSSKRFAKGVFLESDLPGIFFSDNFFDLIPGQSKLVKITGGLDNEASEIVESLRVVSLMDSYQ